MLRATCGAGVLVILVVRIGPRELLGGFHTFHWPYYGVAIGLLGTLFLFQSVMLKILLASQGLSVRARHLFRLTLICQFFGVFLPGGIGPDLLLCYNAARATSRKESVLSAIMFIRIATLFVMALFAFASSFHPLTTRPIYQWLTGLVLTVFLLSSLFLANRQIQGWLARRLDAANRFRGAALCYKTYFALASCGRDTAIMGRIAPWIVASALIKILTDYTIARALGLNVSPLHFFVAVPLVTVVSIVPASVAGLGLREGAYVGLLTQVGLPAEQALAVSLLSFTLIFMIAGVGAVLYLFYGTNLATHQNNIDRSGSN